MNDDLREVISTSKAARDKLLAGDLSVKEANGVASQNHNIIGSYAIGLRERMFADEMTSLAASIERRAPQIEAA